MVKTITLLKLTLCDGVFFVKRSELSDHIAESAVGGDDSFFDYLYNDKLSPQDSVGMDGIWANGDDDLEDCILSHVYTKIDDGTDPFEQFKKMGLLTDVKK